MHTLMICNAYYNGYQKTKKLDIVKFKDLEIANRDLKKAMK